MNLEELLPLMFDPPKKPKAKEIGKKSKIFLTYKGETLPLSVWADRLDVSASTLSHRCLRGWSPERVIETPINKKKRNSRAKVYS